MRTRNELSLNTLLSINIISKPSRNLFMNKYEVSKSLLTRFTLSQLHDLCKIYKREINPTDYRDRITLGESDPEIIKKRLIPYIAGFFDQAEIMEFASEYQIKID